MIRSCQLRRWPPVLGQLDAFAGPDLGTPLGLSTLQARYTIHSLQDPAISYGLGWRRDLLVTGWARSRLLAQAMLRGSTESQDGASQERGSKLCACLFLLLAVHIV